MNRIIQTIFAMLLVWLVATEVTAQIIVPKRTSISEEEYKAYEKYPYIQLMDSGVPKLSDDEFYRLARKVVFPVNKYILPLDSPFIKELKNEVLPMINSHNLELGYMMLRGAASPEGPLRWNQFLGDHRGRGLLNFINGELTHPIADSLYNRVEMPEDYAYLCKMMLEARDPEYYLVQKYYNLYKDDVVTLKKKLMAERTLWRRILKQYFPQLRAARVILFFRKYQEPFSTMVVDTTTYETAKKVEVPESSLWTGNVSQKPLWRPRMLAIRTNLLYDGFYMPNYGWAPSPNIQLEYFPRTGRYTFNLGFTFPYYHRWARNQFFQIRDYNIEVRRYFKGGGKFCGPYMSLYVNNNIYGIGLSKTKGWEGEGLGGGMVFGWTVNLSRHHRWRLEFSLGFGYYQTKYDPYVYGNPITGSEADDLYYYDYHGSAANFKERNHLFRWIGPTSAGIHLTYDLLYYRVQKKGVGFKMKEMPENTILKWATMKVKHK